MKEVNDMVKQTFIDPHHHPEAAAELERLKLGLGDSESLPAAMMDGGPRRREDPEDMLHARLGGPIPEELISNDERTAQYTQEQADQYNKDLEGRRRDVRGEIEAQHAAQERSKEQAEEYKRQRGEHVSDEPGTGVSEQDPAFRKIINPDKGKDLGNTGDDSASRPNSPGGDKLSERNPTVKVPDNTDMNARLKEIAAGTPDPDEEDED
jgi:hypothetical protein